MKCTRNESGYCNIFSSRWTQRTWSEEGVGWRAAPAYVSTLTVTPNNMTDGAVSIFQYPVVEHISIHLLLAKAECGVLQINLSNAREVTLWGLKRNQTGFYKCEVSADAPSFHTEIRSALMIVTGNDTQLYLRRWFSPLVTSRRIGFDSGRGCPRVFRMWELCQTMPLVGGFSWGSSVSPALAFRPAPNSSCFTLIGSHDQDVKSLPNLSTSLQAPFPLFSPVQWAMPVDCARWQCEMMFIHAGLLVSKTEGLRQDLQRPVPSVHHVTNSQSEVAINYIRPSDKTLANQLSTDERFGCKSLGWETDGRTDGRTRRAVVNPAQGGCVVVTEFSDENPILEVEKLKYSLGEKIRANCTSRPSYPAANLTWFINGQQPRNEDSQEGPGQAAASSRLPSALKHSPPSLQVSEAGIKGVVNVSADLRSAREQPGVRFPNSRRHVVAFSCAEHKSSTPAWFTRTPITQNTPGGWVAETLDRTYNHAPTYHPPTTPAKDFKIRRSLQHGSVCSFLLNCCVEQTERKTRTANQKPPRCQRESRRKAELTPIRYLLLAERADIADVSQNRVDNRNCLRNDHFLVTVVEKASCRIGIVRSRNSKLKGIRRLSLASHQGELGSIPGLVTTGFSQRGIAPDDAAGQRVCSGISCYPRLCIPVLLHSNLISPSSALETSLLGVSQISQLKKHASVIAVVCHFTCRQNKLSNIDITCPVPPPFSPCPASPQRVPRAPSRTVGSTRRYHALSFIHAKTTRFRRRRFAPHFARTLPDVLRQRLPAVAQNLSQLTRCAEDGCGASQSRQNIFASSLNLAESPAGERKSLAPVSLAAVGIRGFPRIGRGRVNERVGPGNEAGQGGSRRFVGHAQVNPEPTKDRREGPIPEPPALMLNWLLTGATTNEQTAGAEK
ncbi:hypothetical protein PR048_017016 [Dryococelus australis]|uniref:CD80-like immunoglobulin C2-set domain-containing protein n=1 Tax=Dryococelus australis TaxID=614101 RepID=A0ABQ9H8B7_9NEOP|nr:hypothetical protein PR048_017016 [Dryococelus australis]